MQWIKLIIVIILSNLLISCGQVNYIQPQLPLPDRLVVPKIKAAELACLNKSVNDRLAEIIAKRKARIKRLRAIIKTTHKAKN